MKSDAVRQSRAGDKFHYLWAARRCLLMVHPLSPVQAITIEGSPEPNAAGEYVIDVGEVLADDSGSESVRYYQLKHSTVRTQNPTNLSELTKTLAGFGARFREKPKRNQNGFTNRSFLFVSNRPVSASIKDAISLIAKGAKAPAKIATQLATITGLSKAELQRFCGNLTFLDQEGDYLKQERELRAEVARYTGSVDDGPTSRLVGLVWDQALPTPKGARARGTISRERVLWSLGVDNAQDLFPAPMAMESISNAFLREQHRDIVRCIAKKSSQMILHAPGGVGKSVVARQLAGSFAKGSVGLVYDCYGGGNYMNPSRPRHRASDALVQMANELATQGLCQIMIASPQTPPDVVMRNFLSRLEEASNIVRKLHLGGRPHPRSSGKRFSALNP